MTERELKDVADKYIPLETVLFPENKENCKHVVLTDFFLKTKKGCIMRCANCKKLVENICPCAIGETLKVKTTGELLIVLPCDGYEMKKTGLYK